MEAALAHGQTDANFIQILKLAIHHETDFKVTNTFGKSKKVTIHFLRISPWQNIIEIYVAEDLFEGNLNTFKNAYVNC